LEVYIQDNIKLRTPGSARTINRSVGGRYQIGLSQTVASNRRSATFALYLALVGNSPPTLLSDGRRFAIEQVGGMLRYRTGRSGPEPIRCSNLLEFSLDEIMIAEASS